MTKTTQTMVLTALANGLANGTIVLDTIPTADAIAVTNAMLEAKARKSASSSAKRSAIQLEADNFIASLMTVQPMTVGEIIKANALDISEWSTSRVTSVLSRLVKSGTVTNEKVGKKSLYRLAK